MSDKSIVFFSNGSIEEKKDKIANLGIYELRGVARALGVPSPTTKKREFLVEAILDLLSKDNIETPKTNSKGRPYKKLESVDTILNLLGENSVKPPEIQKTVTYDDLIILAQETPVFEYSSDETVKKQGVLRLISKSSYFIDINSNEVVFVNADLLEKIDLQNGDFIEGFAYKINQNNQYNLKEISKINGVLLKDYECKIEPMRVKVLPKRSEIISNEKIFFGVRNVIFTENPLFLEEDKIKFLNKLDKSFEKIIFVGLDLCFEDQLLLGECETFTKFTTEYGKDNLQKNFDKLIDAINYCERIIKSGESAILVVYDLVKVLSALDKYFAVAENSRLNLQHYQQSEIIAEKLISLASAYANNNDFTMVLICNKLDEADVFMKEVLKISKIIK